MFAEGTGRVRRIGFLAVLPRSTAAKPDVYYDAFVNGMRDLGYVEGKNLVIEWRSADGNFDRLPALAAELAHQGPELIVTHSTPAIRALQRVTRTIPIVFAVAIDPVRSGFAASLARPGGNVTGLSVIDVDPTPKRLELLKTMRPSLSRAALLVNPRTGAHDAVVKELQAAAGHIGVDIEPVAARDPQEIERRFAALAKAGAQGVIVADDALFRGQRQQIASLGIRHRLAAIAPWREYVAVGGLLSYGQDVAESFQRAALYCDRILKGANPAELAIEQPTRIHLAINRRTASTLGLTVPQELLLRADEIID